MISRFLSSRFGQRLALWLVVLGLVFGGQAYILSKIHLVHKPATVSGQQVLPATNGIVFPGPLYLLWGQTILTTNGGANPAIYPSGTCTRQTFMIDGTPAAATTTSGSSASVTVASITGTSVSLGYSSSGAGTSETTGMYWISACN